MVTLLRSLRRPEARRRVFDATATYVRGNDLALRHAMTRHVAEELGLSVLTHAITDADTAAFWRQVALVVDSVDLGPRVRRRRATAPARATHPPDA